MLRPFFHPSFCHPNTVTWKISKFSTPSFVREYPVLVPITSNYNRRYYCLCRANVRHNKREQSRGLPRKNCVNSEPGGELLLWYEWKDEKEKEEEEEKEENASWYLKTVYEDKYILPFMLHNCSHNNYWTRMPSAIE